VEGVATILFRNFFVTFVARVTAVGGLRMGFEPLRIVQKTRGSVASCRRILLILITTRTRSLAARARCPGRRGLRSKERAKNICRVWTSQTDEEFAAYRKRAFVLQCDGAERLKVMSFDLSGVRRS